MDFMQVKEETVSSFSAGEKMSFIKRFTGVIFAPGAVMEDLSEKPRILFGILASIFTMPLFYLIRLPMFISELRDSQLEAIPVVSEKFGYTMTPEMVETQLPLTAATGFIASAFTGIISLLLLTLIFVVIFKIMGGQGKIKAYVSVTGYAYVVMILYFIITIIASFFTGSLHQKPSLTSLANLLPQDMKGGFLYGAASEVDVYRIWYFVVIAIGMATVSKIKMKFVYGTVFIIYVISLIITGFGAVAANAFM